MGGYRRSGPPDARTGSEHAARKHHSFQCTHAKFFLADHHRSHPYQMDQPVRTTRIMNDQVRALAQVRASLRGVFQVRMRSSLNGELRGVLLSFH